MVVPEINASELTKEDKIIANPKLFYHPNGNGSESATQKYKIKRVIVSTYQSVSGTGKAAVDQLNAEIANAVNPGSVEVNAVYPYQIFKMHCHNVMFLYWWLHQRRIKINERT